MAKKPTAAEEKKRLAEEKRKREAAAKKKAEAAKKKAPSAKKLPPGPPITPPTEKELADLRKKEAEAKAKRRVNLKISGSDGVRTVGQSTETKKFASEALDITQTGKELVRDAKDGAIDPRDAPRVADFDTRRIDKTADARAETGHSVAAVDKATNTLGYADDARIRQTANLNELNNLAAGRGPSVGKQMFDQGAIRAQGLMSQAGAEAAGQFGAASLEQQQAARAAGVTAADQVQQQSAAALRAQAAMASSARGGNVGAAMLQGMNNQALGTQAATAQGGRIMRDANMQAADIAARSNLQTAGALERANIAGANVGAEMMNQGAQTASAEQLAAYGMRSGALNDLRGQDLGQVDAAANVAGAAEQLDSRLTGVNVGNTDRKFAGSQANLNAGLASDQLNAGLQTGNAERAAGFMRGNQADELARLGLGTNTQLAGNAQFGTVGSAADDFNRNRALADAGAKNQSRDRFANVLTGQQTNANNRAIANKQSSDSLRNALIGGGIAAAATAGAAYLGSAPSAPPGAPGNGPPGSGPGQFSPQNPQGGQFGSTGQSLNVTDPAEEERKRRMGTMPVATRPTTVTSDIRAKKNIKPADKAARLMISALTGRKPSVEDEDDDVDFRKADAYEYEYKRPKKHGVGKYVGPMAQDLPTGTVGKDRDGTLHVKADRVVMLMATALGQQQKRLDKLERARG